MNKTSNRMKWISRIAKWWIIICACFSLWLIGNQCLQAIRFGIPDDPPPYLWGLSMAAMLVTVVWYGFLARLFHLYERGTVFELQNTRCIGTLGLIFIAWWVIGVPLTKYQQDTQTKMAQAYYHQTVAPGERIPAEAVEVKTRYFNQSLFGVDVGWGLNLHILGAGIIILLIARTMEEGCKLREDQELTV